MAAPIKMQPGKRTTRFKLDNNGTAGDGDSLPLSQGTQWRVTKIEAAAGQIYFIMPWRRIVVWLQFFFWRWVLRKSVHISAVFLSSHIVAVDLIEDVPESRRTQDLYGLRCYMKHGQRIQGIVLYSFKTFGGLKHRCGFIYPWGEEQPTFQRDMRTDQITIPNKEGQTPLAYRKENKEREPIV